MSNIHPSAVIEDGVQLGSEVKVGAFSHIGSGVILDDEVVVESHVAIYGKTHIGRGCHIYPFASIGHIPQDLKYMGETSELVIGANTVIREHVTMNPGTQGGGMVTRCGDNCLLMVGAHVAHDCIIGDRVILVNNATLGGHVEIGDYSIIGGLAAVHQFVRVGEHAMVGGLSALIQDLIPYGSAVGNRAVLEGLNLTGLRRRDFSRDDIHDLRNAYKALFVVDDGTLQERIVSVKEQFNSKLVNNVINFLQADSHRKVCLPVKS